MVLKVLRKMYFNIKVFERCQGTNLGTFDASFLRLKNNWTISVLSFASKILDVSRYDCGFLARLP